MEGIDQGWRKSSYSGNGAECVEVATRRPGVVAVRDSKNPHGLVLAIESVEWRDFIAEVKGRQDDLI